MESKLREEFEAWRKKQTSIDPYIKSEMWDVWQASRAALVIELPDWFGPYGGSGEQAYWRLEVDKAIEAAGVKYK